VSSEVNHSKIINMPPQLNAKLNNRHYELSRNECYKDSTFSKTTQFNRSKIKQEKYHDNKPTEDGSLFIKRVKQMGLEDKLNKHLLNQIIVFLIRILESNY